MNQFQIINRQETWRDEKKDENKQDPADKKKLFTSHIKLLYIVPCLYNWETWCKLRH